jgi:hypothetical protein
LYGLSHKQIYILYTTFHNHRTHIFETEDDLHILYIEIDFKSIIKKKNQCYLAGWPLETVFGPADPPIGWMVVVEAWDYWVGYHLKWT